ncbi:hypothetical protein GF356_09835, partial [candidate division GN15 bacterium]|nr:hypothetical protein [candidate division GN15 bacterium]
MKYIVMAALLVASLAVGVVAQDEPLSREEQIKIITGYMYMRGQLDDMPEHMVAATSEPHDHGHGHDHDSRGAIIKCGTPAILAFQLNKHRLDKELMQELGVELWDRPTDKVDTFRDSDSGWFRIHYTTAGEDAVYRANVDNNANGHPDYVDTVAMVMDSVRIFLIDSLGYPLPPSDGFYPAGDGPLYDVYLYDIGPSF